MMETKQDNNALKEALKKRKVGELPSNFSYQMMNKVRLEAQKQRKRNKLLFRLSFGAAIVSVVSFAIYVLFFYLEFNLMDYMPQPELAQPSSQAMGFYCYIGLLVLILLGGDYWMRYKRRKSADD